ncbi:hypothetical protein Q9R08_04990 [Microbacterium sp. QXD-8]|uniref:Uncharacterized protein n=1 Tax=Microbacterium psychrotolerans TaxID=3068321 RepID=A0ABU0YYB8_9MICO|nr:hypothetical protein [Microbacterium sp. QXD-8]MDQ7877328.1 hypothetical protein [Microbacterium sp. QXD-8]
MSVTVTPTGDGGLRLAQPATFFESDSLSVQGLIVLSPDHVAAVRSHLFAENDEEIGRWRWSEHPDYVVYSSDEVGLGCKVIRESDGESTLITRSAFNKRGSLLAIDRSGAWRAAGAYFDAHPQEPAWASAQIITWDSGAYLVQIAQRDPQKNGGHDKGWWTEEGQDGRWLSTERLVALIGKADVKVLR